MCCESCKKTKSLEKEIQQLKKLVNEIPQLRKDLNAESTRARKAEAILKVESAQRAEQIYITFKLVKKVAHRAGICDDAVEVDIWEIQHKRRQELAEKN